MRVTDEQIKKIISEFGWTLLASSPKELAPKVITTTYEVQKPAGETKEYTAGEIIGLAHDYGWEY